MLVAHISDLHLGRASPGDPHGAERLNSFRQALSALARYKPDVLVIAGDTFDSPQTDPATVEEAARCLGAALKGDGIPIVIIPGNHDPADADQLWSAFQKFLGDAPVSLVLSAAVLRLANGKLLVEAYPCATRYSAAPPWENRLQLPADAEGAAHIVVAHGTLQGGPIPEGEGDAYPFTQPDVESLGADYVALGHFHGIYPPWKGGDEIERGFCYCGSHEPDQFGGDAGHAALAEVVKGQPTRLRRIKVGKRQWRLVEIAGPGDLPRVESLRDEVAASEQPSRYVIRFKVDSGAGWLPDQIQYLTRLEKALRTLGAHVECRGQPKANLDVGGLDLSGLPSGAVKEALLSLQAELSRTPEGPRHDVCAAALQLGWEKIRESMPS